MDYTCLLVDGRQVAGAMPPMMEGVPPHWNVYFNVESVDDTAAKVVELGGKVVAPPFDVPGVGRMAVLADPQGAMFNLMAGLSGSVTPRTPRGTRPPGRPRGSSRRW